MNAYTRLGVASLEEIIPKILSVMNNEDTHSDICGYTVRIRSRSLRLLTFGRDSQSSRGLSCRGCNLVASFFAVERFTYGKETKPHINLYGVKEDGIEVLFTHDHILARGLGGKDRLDNTQTMCLDCNQKKGQIECEGLNSARSNGVLKHRLVLDR
jgi:hypothetical protein